MRVLHAAKHIVAQGSWQPSCADSTSDNDQDQESLYTWRNTILQWRFSDAAWEVWVSCYPFELIENKLCD